MRPLTVNLLLSSLLLHYTNAASLDYQPHAPMPYEYAYGVSYPPTGDAKEHKERTTKDGRTEGEYRWLQPNGLYRVVRYYVEGPSGFVAEVTEEEGPEIVNYVSNSLSGEYRNPVFDDSYSSSGYQGSTAGYGTLGQSGGQNAGQYGAPSAGGYGSLGQSARPLTGKYGAPSSGGYASLGQSARPLTGKYGAPSSSQYNSGSAYGAPKPQRKSSYGSQSYGSSQGYSSNSLSQSYGSRGQLSALNQLSQAQLGLSNQYAKKHRLQNFKSTDSYSTTKTNQKSRKYSTEGYGMVQKSKGSSYQNNQLPATAPVLSKSKLNTYGNIINAIPLSSISSANMYGGDSSYNNKGSSYGQTGVTSNLIQSNTYENNLQTGLKSNIRVFPLQSPKSQLLNPHVATAQISLGIGQQKSQYTGLGKNQVQLRPASYSGSKLNYDEGSVVKGIQTKYSSFNSQGKNSYNANIQQDYTPQQGYLPPQNSYEAPKPTYDVTQNIIPSHINYNAPQLSYEEPQISYRTPVKDNLIYQAPATVIQTPQNDYLPPSQSYELPKQDISQVSYAAPQDGYQAPQSDYQSPSTGYDAPITASKPLDNSYEAPKSIYQLPQTGYLPPSPTIITGKDNLVSHIPSAGNAGILKLEGEDSLSTSYGPPEW